MDSAEQNSKKDLASNSTSDREVIMNIEHSGMDWEMTNAIDGAEEVNDTSNIVSSVPVEKMEDGMAMGAVNDDMDIESFSFGSEAEDNLYEADATRTPELSISFDIKVLQTVVEASAHALDIVTGKDVVLVAGKTGVGKSTLLQGIAGKTIVEIQHKTSFSGMLATKTAYDAEDALPAFEIGHLKKSKTNALNALVRGEGDDEIVYLDTPGFEDTSGVEMDIATAAQLSQVAKRCKSLRFVIIIHCASLIEDRGGAFRSVLKFARAFVQDFDKSKLSFMFLFSHTDEICGMSSSLTDARARLQEEILRTAEGTDDQEVSLVLKYIRKSLSKGYHFVQIFHPLAMDYHKLTREIESKLAKVTNLTLAKSPSMTLASKLKLESASQSLVQRLRVALRECSQDIVQAVDIRMMLQSLTEYIDVDCLRHAAIESKSIIDEHIKVLQTIVADHVSRGTSSDVEFNEENILELKRCFMQLDKLCPSTSSRCVANIESRLLEFSERIIQAACSARTFHRELHKVFVWAEGFDEFAPIYAQTSKQIAKYSDELLSDILQVDVSCLSSLSLEDLPIFVRKLASLNAVCQQVTQFPSTCTIDILNTMRSNDSIMDAVKSNFNAWLAAATKFSKYSDVFDEKGDIDFLARAALAVRVIHTTLESAIECSSFRLHHLEELAFATSRDIESAVTGRFSRHCTELGQSKFNLSWKPRLFWMQSICISFAEMRGESWKCMKTSLSSIIDSIKADLHRASGEIENMCSMIRNHSGMVSGVSFAKEIISLDECKWVDGFLPTDQQFVSKSCKDVLNLVIQRIDLKRVELESIINLNIPVDGTNVKLINDLGELLPELRELDKFSDLMNGYSAFDEISCGLASKCEKFLEDFVSNLSSLATTLLASWVCNNKSGNAVKMCEITRNLDNVLANNDALRTIGGSTFVNQQTSAIQSQLKKEFSKFNQAFKTEFSSLDGGINAKAGILATIQACKGFRYVECQIVNHKEAVQTVVRLVLEAASKIEKSIEASSEWDKVDKSILEFESATALDHFASGQVASRLRTLQRLREQKEMQVDDRMGEMIQNQDFRGIGAFLSPLAKSNDQLKKQKFLSHREKIASILKDTITEVNLLLSDDAALEANSMTAAKKMTILVAAQSELQTHLTSKLNITYEISTIKRRMNGILGQFTKHITKAVKEIDFVQMMVNGREGSIFLSNFRQHLSSSIVRDFESAQDKIKREVEETVILKYVECFVTSDFKDGDKLFKSIESLKQANKRGGEFPKLVKLYEIVKNRIESYVRERSREVKEFVSESKCFDDGITCLHSLHRHLQMDLRDHCSSALVSHVANLVEDLRGQKKLNDRFLELDGKEFKDNLEELAKQLNKLGSIPPFSFWKAGSSRETYLRLRKDLLEKVESRFNQSLIALKARDLLSVQGTIEFLELVHMKAGKHVDVVDSRIRVVRKQCVDAFCSLCTEATKLLSSDNCLPFKEIFADYRGFVIHTTCVLESQNGQKNFSHVCQLLYKSLENALSHLEQNLATEILDSTGLRNKLMFIRSWGSFVADHLTLLHEEVRKMSEKTKPDMTWLGKIHNFCWDHFNIGRDLSKMQYCVILGVTPSASKSAIKRAFKAKAKLYHPDKNKSEDASANFRMIRDAEEQLLTMSHISSPTRIQPFDELVLSVGQRLSDRAQSFMDDQRYDMVEKLLFELRNIKILDDLIVPKLNSDEISSSVLTLVKNCVQQSRVEVDSHWTARNYKELNDVISSLQSMQRHLKSYSQIFPKSWDTEITKKIEQEIDCLGDKARGWLQNRAQAVAKQGDFRRCFIQMGFVLTELPSFNSYTKSVMSDVLSSCLNAPWGYGYLFELGLALQKGDDASTDDENRVAQMIVNEFSHFKEVLVMVWNEEVLQKPADEVVKQIRGEVYSTSTQSGTLAVDQSQLLVSFAAYEREYKSLVADYIKPDADLNALVHKTLALASKVSPPNSRNCSGEDLKQAIPLLLAGVFSLLTILKSGASYNRIEEASGSVEEGEKLLMKPHNIQVLSLLLMLGCGSENQDSIENQLMQIRTGEGKSMILGAASTMFALLGFRVRTVCYSEFLSARDFQLFEDVFQHFGLIDYIKYSKITSFAEDTTAKKGDIRRLTESLLRGNLLPASASSSIYTSTNHSTKDLTPPASSIIEPRRSARTSRNNAVVVCTNSTNGVSCKAEAVQINLSSIPQKRNFSVLSTTQTNTQLHTEYPSTLEREEILLVDEVDVFFGSEFYGQTYNQVVEFKEPEIEEILKRIWNAWSHGGRRPSLNDIKSMPEYKKLLRKLSAFAILLDTEISRMLDQVSKVEDIPYHVDLDHDRIGYKVLDSISYDVTYGYATCYAYLKELSKFRNKAILSKVLVMPISCGQFSYANISPHRILGVSGTLQALAEHEREILMKYGLNKYIYVPSVYGASNFQFDKAGEGIYFEKNNSDFFHRISAQITVTTKKKRAVIVFFRDRAKLDEFIASPMYRKLDRHKKLLLEDMPTTEKNFVISKAATAGQITLSTAVFGRGTDFFCKDEVVEKNGGVHIIQTFLSEELSEEIQIQGRTARQGKKGSYQMILLETDLQSQFGTNIGDKDKIPQKDLYEWLCNLRLLKHRKRCSQMEENLKEATLKDCATHRYFDSLLTGNTTDAKSEFEELYRSMKKAPMPTSLLIDLAFAIDLTGSMAPYSSSVISTIGSLIAGSNSILEKLKITLPEIEFKLRVGSFGFRDVDDKPNQFQDNVWKDGSHFTDDIPTALQGIKSLCGNAYGGADIAEDHIGAIHHCANSWTRSDDWTSEIKCMILFSDAPTHGLVRPEFSGDCAYDSYPTHHPDGLKVDDAVASLLAKDISLFFCSFDPHATAKTEEEISRCMKDHPENKSDGGIVLIPMVAKNQVSTRVDSFKRHGRHIIFVLDESGSMQGSWNGVVEAYRKYIEKRKQSQSCNDLVSVVQFNDNAHVAVNKVSLSNTPHQLSYRGGGTNFHPAALDACKLAHDTPESHAPVIIFMSDGEAYDASAAAREFSILNQRVSAATGNDLELHVIAFGAGASIAQLEMIARASKIGKVHTSANVADLTSVFVAIATNANVATVLESEIAKRMSEAVSNMLSLEYFGS